MWGSFELKPLLGSMIQFLSPDPLRKIRNIFLQFLAPTPTFSRCGINDVRTFSYFLPSLGFFFFKKNLEWMWIEVNELSLVIWRKKILCVWKGKKIVWINIIALASCSSFFLPINWAWHQMLFISFINVSLHLTQKEMLSFVI